MSQMTFYLTYSDSGLVNGTANKFVENKNMFQVESDIIEKFHSGEWNLSDWQIVTVDGNSKLMPVPKEDDTVASINYFKIKNNSDADIVFENNKFSNNLSLEAKYKYEQIKDRNINLFITYDENPHTLKDVIQTTYGQLFEVEIKLQNADQIWIHKQPFTFGKAGK